MDVEEDAELASALALSLEPDSGSHGDAAPPRSPPPNWCSEGCLVRDIRTGQPAVVMTVEAGVDSDTDTYLTVRFADGSTGVAAASALELLPEAEVRVVQGCY